MTELARWCLAGLALTAVMSGACSDEDELPVGPLLSLADCNQLQAEFDATLDSDPGTLDRLNEGMEDGGCYATDEERGEMLERDGGEFGDLSD